VCVCIRIIHIMDMCIALLRTTFALC